MSPLQLYDTRTRAKLIRRAREPTAFPDHGRLSGRIDVDWLEDSPTGVRWRRSTR